MKPNYFRLFVQAAMGVTAITLGVAYAVICTYVYLEPTLPSVSAMKNNELAVPLRVYTRAGDLIAQIGEQRRNPVKYDQIPLIVRQAFIAAEDDRFFEHHGIDWQGVLRSIFVNLTSRETQGGSTITMQAARSAFLTQERDWRRKLQETFVTYRLEREFTKQEILALYLNVIFFGQRSYGVASAAETYFGKPLDQLTLSEAATLARVPQWPSRYNPITNPTGAAERRGYVLRRMRELGFVDAAAAEAASHEVVRAEAHRARADVEAPYVAEMVRLEIIKRFGPAAQDAGYKVYTTLDGRLQTAADRALRVGLIDYDRRQGWRGATNKVELSGNEKPEALELLLDEYGSVGILQPALVINVGEKSAQVFIKGAGIAPVEWAGLSWAKRRTDGSPLGPEPKTAGEIIARGDVVYVVREKSDGPAALAQIPEAESALVALDPNNGAILSLVGGFDYFDKTLGKFNRVTMAHRQPGSGFKPFMYAAAMAGNYTPASVILDAPIILDDSNLEEVWRPENSGGGFRGPLRLREALVQSRNLVSIRLLKEMGVKSVIDYVQAFGFTKQQLPTNLTLALGSMPATPLEVARGFAVFANGGSYVEPFYIDRIEGPGGEIVFTAEPKTVCAECAQPIVAISDAERAKQAEVSATFVPPTPLPGPRRTEAAERVITPQVSFLMNDIMRDVITRGTGRRALALGRADLRGKTGTTNLNFDTWFNGFNDSIVASVWVGLDEPGPLGAGEEGARTAVPIWVDYMREALRGVPEKPRTIPDGIIEMKVNAATGGTRNADVDPLFEYFRADMLPTEEGYVGGESVGPQDIDPTSPTAPQGGADPIFWVMKKLTPRAENLRRALAQEAARIMSEHGIRDFLTAKRKAAERFGVTDGSVLPKNTEIEDALAEYQRLFGGTKHGETLAAQRNAALSAMHLLADFQPRLVGSVLSGTATEHNDIQLHLFAERPESITFRLMDFGIEHEVVERRVRFGADRVLAYPGVHFDFEDHTVDATVFPVDGIRQAPVSPVDGKPMRRVDAEELEVLMDVEDAPLAQ